MLGLLAAYFAGRSVERNEQEMRRLREQRRRPARPVPHQQKSTGEKIAMAVFMALVVIFVMLALA